jgi:hypothetical protein
MEKLYALYDFTSEEEHELSIHAGEELTVENDVQYIHSLGYSQ